MAERVGFEPTVPFGTHAFQACALSRSAISPRGPVDSNRGGRQRERPPRRLQERAALTTARAGVRGPVCSQILSTAESCRRRRPREVSQFASRDSLLVGRNFPVPEFREIRRVGPRGGAGRENLAHPEAGFGGVPCIFPADQGFRQKRRVRDRLHAPPFSLRLRRLRARSAI